MNENSQSMTVALASYLLKSRERREQWLGRDLFGDPAWDILLDLYIAQRQQRQMSVTSVCIGSGVPVTTALRWIRTLEGRGLLERGADLSDGRRVLIGLKPEAVAWLDELLDRTAQELRTLLRT